MNKHPVRGSKHVSGDLSNGRLILVRKDGSRARCGVVIHLGGTLTDNSDSTYTFTLPE